MRKIAALLGTLGFMSVTGSASAVQYTTWDFKNTSLTAFQDVAACGSNTAVCQTTLTVNGNLMKVRAYSTNDTTGVTTGKLVGANITKFSDSGLGVDNVKEPEGSGGGTIDNTNNIYDVLVFEAFHDNFNWKDVQLGFANPGSDFQAWAGGSGAGLDFSQMCLTSGGACAANKVINDNFTKLGSFDDKAINTAIALNSGSPAGPAVPKGRYLVVSGELSSNFNDAFKIKSITGAPEPQTFALLGIGLLAMVGLSRRKTVFS